MTTTKDLIALLRFLLDLGPQIVDAFDQSKGDARKVFIETRIGEMDANQAAVDAALAHKQRPSG